MMSAKWWPFCLSLNVFYWYILISYHFHQILISVTHIVEAQGQTNVVSCDQMPVSNRIFLSKSNIYENCFPIYSMIWRLYQITTNSCTSHNLFKLLRPGDTCFKFQWNWTWSSLVQITFDLWPFLVPSHYLIKGNWKCLQENVLYYSDLKCLGYFAELQLISIKFYRKVYNAMLTREKCFNECF